ncbi:Adenylate cyclase type 10, partial [Lobosporangium transversale]
MAEEECKPSINIAPYMSKFVRSLHVEEDHPILKTPFSYTQFGAVLMVDIVGFSQMTSIASSKGDVGAEMLSSQIGAYFDMAIRIIEYHGGDIVKFLGDALLVVFQADPSAERLQTPESTPDTIDDHTDPFLSSDGIQASSQKRDKIAVRKAIECSLELLTRLSNYRIYLSQREFSRRCSASSSGSDGSNKDEGGNTIANTMQGNEPTPNGLDMLRSSEHDSRSPHHQNITAGLSDLQLLTNNSSTSLAGSTTSDRSSADSSPQMNPPKPSHAKALHNAVTRHVPPRLIIGTGPGAASIPALHIIAPTPTVASKPYLDHSNIPTPISTPAIPGGVSDLKRREGLIPSGSSRPGSATPRMRAGLIATAKHLFGGHSNPSDKQAGNTKGEAQVTEAGTAPNDAHELQLHMALSAGDI